jgi:type I restriction enzyme, S subunit
VSRWPMVAIGEVADPVDRSEVPLAGVTYRQVGVRLWGVGAYERASIEGDETKYKTLNRVEAGDIIVNKIWARNGSVSVVTPSLEGCFCSGEFPLFRPRPGRLDPQWFYWITKARWFWEACDRQSRGTSGKNRLRPQRFLEIAIPLAPIEEQRRVVEKLNRLATRAAMVRTAQLRADADSLALRRVLYAKAEREASRRGARVPLSSLIASHDSGWSPQCEDDPASPGLWGVLKTTCVQWDGFRAGANKALRLALAPRPELAVRRADILITRAGPLNRVGVACVVPEDHACLMLSDKIVRMVPAPDVDPDFIVAMLGAPGAQEYFRQSKTGLAASQVNISRARLLTLEVPLPALHEQRRLAKALLRSLSALDRCTQKRHEGTPVVAAFERAMLRIAFD